MASEQSWVIGLILPVEWGIATPEKANSNAHGIILHERILYA
jgi:hypothetical protein